MNGPESSLATLFADVAGSTGLYQRHGDQIALTAVNDCLAVLKTAAQDFGGRVVKTIGDELMAVFPTADEAFTAACEMQWRISELPPVGGDALAVRIGFHLGPALEQDGDVFGDSVNVAARLVGLARARQIITSGRTVGALSRPLAAYTRKLSTQRLRGMDTEEVVFEALWEDGDNVTTLMPSMTNTRINSARLLVRYRGTEVVVGPERHRATFGRDETNDVVVVSRRVSRVHARFEWRRDKFILADQSTNGTYLSPDGGAETRLRLEETTLQGRGFVSLGSPIAAGDGELLEYSVEVPARAIA